MTEAVKANNKFLTLLLEFGQLQRRGPQVGGSTTDFGNIRQIVLPNHDGNLICGTYV